MSAINKIFRPAKSVKELIKRTKFINGTLKMYFISPIISIGKIFIGKRLVTQREQIPLEAWNANLLIFYDGVQLAVENFHDEFFDPLFNKEGSEEVRKNSKEKYYFGTARGAKAIIFLRNLVVTLALEDTIYRHALDFVMFKLQELMNKRWNPEIQHKIPLYMSSKADFAPFHHAWNALNKKKFNLELKSYKREGKIYRAAFMVHKCKLAILNQVIESDGNNYLVISGEDKVSVISKTVFEKEYELIKTEIKK